MMGYFSKLGVRLAAIALLLGISSCSSLPDRRLVPTDLALEPGNTARLDTLIGREEQRQPGQSGFRLVEHGPEALAIRIQGTALADRSIDVQTYIWQADLTGLYLAHELLLAADRGVRVRLLLDDLSARKNNYALAALDAHPNIAVRLFNPLASRSGTLSLIGELLRDGGRINRRMHNKVWIVDNRIALGGGRNLGNEYFGASNGANFVDLEFAMVGPVVRDASESFDHFWNDEASYPIVLLSPGSASQEALDSIRGQLAQAAREALSSEYAALVAEDSSVGRLVSGDWPITWSRDYRFVSDEPSKIRQHPSPDLSKVLTTLTPALEDATQSIRIISPYFVPGQLGTRKLIEQADRIEKVHILTNSLAANDVIAVHGGYAKYRKPLLQGGTRIWELKRRAGEEVEASWIGSSGASLHTKALSADGDRLFVGSYNLDPRSTSLNCEQGIFLRSSALTAQFNDMFDQLAAGERSWEVSMNAGRLVWYDGQETVGQEPDSTWGQRAQAWLMRWLPIGSQL